MATVRVLGIDQGTSGTRATLVDSDGGVRAHAYRAHAQHTPQPGWVEHDAEEIWQHTLATLRETGSQSEPIDALALANPGETVLLFDRETGKPLHNAIVWQDLRTEPEVARLASDAIVAHKVNEKTGLRLDAYFSASKIRWLLDNVLSARTLAERGELGIATVDAFLIHRLTGGRSFVTDASTAARTLLFDIHASCYDPWLLELFDVPLSALPEVKDTIADFGKVSGVGHALDGVPIVASLVDQPAAMVGQACVARGDIKATYGTGCFVYRNTGGHVAASTNGLLGTVAWRRDGKSTYALEGGVFAAGSMLGWLCDGLGIASGARELDELAASVPDAGGVTCVPAFQGLGAPHWDRGARASWLGITLSSTRADLARAAFESIALRVTEIVRAMERDSGERVSKLRVDGGLTESRVLMQAQADLLGVPVEVSAEPEATVMGTCYLALVALGAWQGDAEIATRVVRRDEGARRFEPRIGNDERDERLARFERAVDAVRSWRSW